MIKLYHTEEMIKNFTIETIILSRGPKFSDRFTVLFVYLIIKFILRCD